MRSCFRTAGWITALTVTWSVSCITVMGLVLPASAQTEFKAVALAADVTVDWFASDRVLSAFVLHGLKHSPELRAIQLSHEAAQWTARSARALPDPQLSGGIVNMGIGRLTVGSDGMSGTSVSLQQNYPHAQKLEVKQLLADQEVSILALEWQWQWQKLRREIQTHYFKAIKQSQSQRILLEMGRWYALLQKMVETRYQVGKVPLQALWQIKLQRSELERQVLVSAQEEAIHWTELRKAMGWPADFQPPSVTRFPVLPQSLSLAATLPENLDPTELHWQRLQRKMSMLELQRAESEKESDYFLAGGLTQRGTLEASWQINAGMTLPIYGESKNEPLIAAAQQRLAAAEAQIEVMQQRLSSQWQSAYTQWHYAQRQQSLYAQQILPEAKASVDAGFAAYQGGQVSVTEVIESITRWLNDQQQLLALEEQRYLALSEMQYLMSGDNR